MLDNIVEKVITIEEIANLNEMEEFMKIIQKIPGLMDDGKPGYFSQYSLFKARILNNFKINKLFIILCVIILALTIVLIIRIIIKLKLKEEMI